ncbi:hypothetical protein M0R36_10765 [bacterium]|jgi:hypothetical protein|nr:hypothetical protein [bacterium]
MKINIEKLRELHDQVKMHPFREAFNTIYINSYEKVLDEFAGETLIKLKEYAEINKINTSGLYNFMHNFRSTIYSFCYHKGKNPLYTEMIEKNIGYIHRFIETGEFKKFETYYSGCNIYKSMNRQRVWILKNKRYSPVYDKEELENIISEIEEYLKKHEPGIMLYNEEDLNCFKKRLRSLEGSNNEK